MGGIKMNENIDLTKSLKDVLKEILFPSKNQRD